ncbi:CoA transferase subunit B [bacterium]|nr:CoA transferase subunit B [bacterium]
MTLKLLSREQLARRAAAEVRPGMYVNLGIGIPTLVANEINTEMNITLQSENGILGMGPFPVAGFERADLINAGKQTVTLTPGASIFSSADSFAMIRGGHIDLTILGAMEVSEQGDIANWMIPGKMVKGMGGAMDLVAGSPNVVVVMQHCAPDGSPKILKQCKLPLTGKRCVKKIISDRAAMVVTPEGLVVTEIIPGLSFEDLQACTEARLLKSPDGIKVLNP